MDDTVKTHKTLTLRIPVGEHALLARIARESRRSLHGEILHRLSQSVRKDVAA